MGWDVFLNSLFRVGFTRGFFFVVSGVTLLFLLLRCCFCCYVVVFVVTLLCLLLLCCFCCYFVVFVVTLLFLLLLCCFSGIGRAGGGRAVN